MTKILFQHYLWMAFLLFGLAISAYTGSNVCGGDVCREDCLD